MTHLIREVPLRDISNSHSSRAENRWIPQNDPHQDRRVFAVLLRAGGFDRAVWLTGQVDRLGRGPHVRRITAAAWWLVVNLLVPANGGSGPVHDLLDQRAYLIRSSTRTQSWGEGTGGARYSSDVID